MDYFLIATLLLAPAYAIRFPLFGLPANILMVWMGIVWIVFGISLAVNKKTSAFFKSILSAGRPTLAAAAIFCASGIISLFIGGTSENKAGQLLVLFLQPVSMFFILRYRLGQNKALSGRFVSACYLVACVCGIAAIIQYFTLAGLPGAYWGNPDEPKRAISFFTHPNFYALFIAPLLAFLLPDAGQKASSEKNLLPAVKNIPFLAAWVVGAIGLFLSLSRSGWLGLFAAGIIYVILAASKNVRRVAVVAGVIAMVVILSVPNLRWRLILPFYGEKSAVSRLSLWHTGWKGIAQAPLTGLGLGGFGDNWKTLNTDPNLDTHNYPHNIFLDFWVETGLAGLAAFVILCGIFLRRGFKNSGPTAMRPAVHLGAALFLVALLVQGQIDNPYFKNDLALLFWMILSLAATGTSREPESEYHQNSAS